MGVQGLGSSALDLCSIVPTQRVWSQPQIPQIALQDSTGVGADKGVGQSQIWQMCVSVAERLFCGWQPGKPICMCGVGAALPSLAYSVKNGHSPCSLLVKVAKNCCDTKDGITELSSQLMLTTAVFHWEHSKGLRLQ